MTIRVLIAEDSVTSRELLVAVLGADPEVTIVGAAKDGQEALEMTQQLRPDVVTMDIQMPRMDGFEATKRIMIEAPTPIVIISGSTSARDVETSMRALHMGALTVLTKPNGSAKAQFEKQCARLVSTVKAMAQVKVIRHWPSRQEKPLPPAPARQARGRILAVATSTGGPAALQELLSGLPPAFPVPVLVVQHIGAEFTAGLVSWLNTTCLLPVKVAEQGERIAPHTVYVAGGDHHMGVSSSETILLSDQAPIAGFRPSATFLFESVANAFGESALAVILTGMGRDGVDGLRAVRQRKGYIIAQNEATSVVFGMPGAAAEAGLADAILPLCSIGPRLTNLV